MAGKKHLVLQSKYGINWRSCTPTFKSFKNKALKDSRRKENRSKPRNSKKPSYSLCKTPLASPIVPVYPVTAVRSTIPLVIPKLRRAQVKRLNFRKALSNAKTDSVRTEEIPLIVPECSQENIQQLEKNSENFIAEYFYAGEEQCVPEPDFECEAPTASYSCLSSELGKILEEKRLFSTDNCKRNTAYYSDGKGSFFWQRKIIVE